MDRKKKALELREKGYNCCQAVACVFSEDTGISEEILFKAAEGFGAGMGGKKSACGALSGAVMIAGFLNSKGNANGELTKESTYAIVRDMHGLFLGKNTTTICEELMGSETGTPLNSCNDCVTDCVGLVEALFNI